MRRVGSRTSLPTCRSRTASWRSRRAEATLAFQGRSVRANQPVKRAGSNGPPRPTSMAAATLASTSSSTPALDRATRTVASPAWRASGAAWMEPAAARSRSAAAVRVSPDRSTPPTRTPRRTCPAALSSCAATSPAASTTTSPPARTSRGTRSIVRRAATSDPGLQRRRADGSLGSAGGSATEMVGSFGMPSGRAGRRDTGP